MLAARPGTDYRTWMRVHAADVGERLVGRVVFGRERATVPLEHAGVRAHELDGVVLVGGSTRVPLVRTLVEQTLVEL